MHYESCRSPRDTARLVQRIGMIRFAWVIFHPTSGGDPKTTNARHLCLYEGGRRAKGSFLCLLQNPIKTGFAYVVRMANLVEQEFAHFFDFYHLAHEADAPLCNNCLFHGQIWCELFLYVITFHLV